MRRFNNLNERPLEAHSPRSGYSGKQASLASTWAPQGHRARAGFTGTLIAWAVAWVWFIRLGRAAVRPSASPASPGHGQASSSDSESLRLASSGPLARPIASPQPGRLDSQCLASPGTWPGPLAPRRLALAKARLHLPGLQPSLGRRGLDFRRGPARQASESQTSPKRNGPSGRQNRTDETRKHYNGVYLTNYLACA